MNKTGLFITAAFIGPGTVTTASLAGANFGYSLVWALMFSVVATLVLQEMASRLGLVTGEGLAEALRNILPSGPLKYLSILLIVSAIGVGNAAYQAGNLTGAALGIQSLTDGPLALWVLLLGGLASLLLWFGKYRLLERVLVVLVGTMGLVFVVTMFLASVDWSAMLKGLVTPTIPDGATLSVIALIGTTVVPYNLFLHASLVAQQKPADLGTDKALKQNRVDTGLSIGLGGLVTLAILSCAASAFYLSSTELAAANIAEQLAPLLGDFSTYFFASGLFAAGLTSAITAPLAAAYAVSGALGWSTSLQNVRFKMVWALVMLIGVSFAVVSVKPLLAIQFAQAANGLLLPVIAIFLLWVMNHQKLLGQYTNRLSSNLIGGLVVAVVALLGSYKLLSLFIAF